MQIPGTEFQINLNGQNYNMIFDFNVYLELDALNSAFLKLSVLLRVPLLPCS